MKRNTKNLLIGSGVAVAALGAVGAISYSMSHALISIATDRRLNITPGIRAKKMLSGCKDIENIEKLCNENAERLKRGDCYTLYITSKDGERLAGHLHLCENAKRTVIAMHGWRSSWAKDFGAVSDFFHSQGCNVLYPEQRGQNNSGGAHIDFGLTERFDCVDWIRLINTDKSLSALPIYLCGVSMGATTVLMATGLSLPHNVVGVIADCGFTSPGAIWKHVSEKNLHIAYDPLRAALIRYICRKKLRIDPDGYSTVDAMKVCRIPVLFVHGSEDKFVPIEMTYDNYRACASEKRLFIVPGADHGMSYFTDKQGYESEVRRFFRECDRRI